MAMDLLMQLARERSLDLQASASGRPRIAAQRSRGPVEPARRASLHDHRVRRWVGNRLINLGGRLVAPAGSVSVAPCLDC